MNPLNNNKTYLKENSFFAIIVLLAVIVIISLIYHLFSYVYYNLIGGNPFFSLIIILALISFFGFKKIPIGHKGIKIRLGRRTRNIVSEGYSWRIPFIEKIEIVDCRERFVSGSNMRLNLANLIPVNIFVSAYFKIDDPYYYFENYSTKDFESKVSSDIMKNLREFLSKDRINEIELQNIKSANFRNDQLTQINSDYLNKLGIKITNITIESIHLEDNMESFYTMIRQADILSLEKDLSYSDALKTSLIMNNKVGNNYNNINFNSETLLEGLKQLKRLKVIANE